MRLIFASLILFFIISPLSAQAQSIQLPDPPMPEILKFSLSPITETCTNNNYGSQDCFYNVPWIGEYISQFYVFAVGVTSILAVVVIMIAGFVWTMAGGNTSQVENAKGYIKGAVTGLILMLGSYTFLYTINPNLVRFDSLRLPVVKNIELEQVNIIENSMSCRWEQFNLASLGGVDPTSLGGTPTDISDCPFGMINGNNCEDSLKKEGQVCCCKKLELSSSLNIVQRSHASPQLAKLIEYVNANRTCYDGTKCGVIVTSISDNNIINGKCQPWKTTGQKYSQPEGSGYCQHALNSNHYGKLRNLRGNNEDSDTLPIQGFSCAVDFSAKSQYDCDSIWEAAVASGVAIKKDGAPNGGCEGNPINHMHIALANCQ